MFVPCAYAKTYKIIAEVIDLFSTKKPAKYFIAKIRQDYFFDDNQKLDQDSIISSKVTKIVSPKEVLISMLKLKVASANKTIITAKEHATK